MIKRFHTPSSDDHEKECLYMAHWESAVASTGVEAIFGVSFRCSLPDDVKFINTQLHINIGLHCLNYLRNFKNFIIRMLSKNIQELTSKNYVRIFSQFRFRFFCIFENLNIL